LSFYVTVTITSKGCSALGASIDDIRRNADSSVTPESPMNTSPQGPLSTRALDAESLQFIALGKARLRPLRLLPIGKGDAWIVEDVLFTDHALELDIPIVFVSNPKSVEEMPSCLRYLKYSCHKTLNKGLARASTVTPRGIEHPVYLKYSCRKAVELLLFTRRGVEDPLYLKYSCREAVELLLLPDHTRLSLLLSAVLRCEFERAWCVDCYYKIFGMEL